MQFIGDEEYSNIRSEKIRVLELGISMPTFIPTKHTHTHLYLLPLEIRHVGLPGAETVNLK